MRELTIQEAGLIFHILPIVYAYIYIHTHICIRLHIHTSCHHYIVHLLSSKPARSKPSSRPDLSLGKTYQQESWKMLATMEDFTNKWHLVNKGRNGKYFHLKKCQNMEVVNYFTNLPFTIFTKNIFP